MRKLDARGLVRCCNHQRVSYRNSLHFYIFEHQLERKRAAYICAEYALCISVCEQQSVHEPIDFCIRLHNEHCERCA